MVQMMLQNLAVGAEFTQQFYHANGDVNGDMAKRLDKFFQLVCTKKLSNLNQTLIAQIASGMFFVYSQCISIRLFRH